MFDWIRERLKDANTKREERVTAYVDGRLSAEHTRQFEAQLAQDDALRAEVATLQAVKQQLTALPVVRAPRNYTLDPALYGAPDSSYGARVYPAVRLATAMAALMFIFMVTLTLLPNGNATQETAMMEPLAAEMPSATEELPAEDSSVDMVIAEEPVEAEAEFAYEIPEDDAADSDAAEEGAAFSVTVEEEVMAEPMATQLPPMGGAADSAVTDDADVADDEEPNANMADDGASTRMSAPTGTPAMMADVPEIDIVTTEVMRSADSITATAGTIDEMETQQTKESEVAETLVSAENPTNWTQFLLIVSIVLFVSLLVLMLWLRKNAKQF